MRPGIEPTLAWILARFISAEPRWELLLTYPLVQASVCVHTYTCADGKGDIVGDTPIQKIKENASCDLILLLIIPHLKATHPFFRVSQSHQETG